MHLIQEVSAYKAEIQAARDMVKLRNRMPLLFENFPIIKMLGSIWGSVYVKSK